MSGQLIGAEDSVLSCKQLALAGGRLAGNDVSFPANILCELMAGWQATWWQVVAGHVVAGGGRPRGGTWWQVVAGHVVARGGRPRGVLSCKQLLWVNARWRAQCMCHNFVALRGALAGRGSAAHGVTLSRSVSSVGILPATSATAL
jgi:hypothetical protein